ncbi:DUF2285 domain-containing protein [Mesorhizobium sp. M1A.F.Ca.ET.072.01.1.1]|uniref:DNA -binding domain-containing protein n=1 Tax=Mesorhizobium sp. M1A.F.Ca.ET.072.01.1.1 TaxID=2496753 RepID=UPI001FDF0A8B|nr:DUF2285 domain-containing protein [Mesorhizobium sp. M1A.F.Ca.ET.072.01.1.1]
MPGLQWQGHSCQEAHSHACLLTQAGLPPRLFPPEARGRSLRFVLRALDGSLAKASYRDIAAHCSASRGSAPTGPIPATICATASTVPSAGTMPS